MEKILAIILAVITDQWTEQATGQQIIDRCRSANWLKSYLSKVMTAIGNMGVTQGYLIAFILLAPLLLGVLLVQQLMMHLLTKMLGSLLFAVFSLFYFLGNKESKRSYSDFVVAHERSFGVLFWFAVLGPVGALTYWFLVASTQSDLVSEQNNASLSAALNRMHAIAAWIPARLTGFLYALLGNFAAGFGCWLSCMRNVSMQSSEVLDQCGKAATDSSVGDEESKLVYRASISWVVLSVLIVILLKAILFKV
jgi:membrane protein required for beta-lactamase induction